jgi:hypothetical protein
MTVEITETVTYTIEVPEEHAKDEESILAYWVEHGDPIKNFTAVTEREVSRS